MLWLLMRSCSSPSNPPCSGADPAQPRPQHHGWSGRGEEGGGGVAEMDIRDPPLGESQFSGCEARDLTKALSAPWAMTHGGVGRIRHAQAHPALISLCRVDARGPPPRSLMAHRNSPILNCNDPAAVLWGFVLAAASATCGRPFSAHGHGPKTIGCP